MKHPFVRGIGAGSVPEEAHIFYLVQDDWYLRAFARVLALTLAKAEDVEAQRFLGELIHVTLNVELAHHREACARFGVEAAVLDAVEPMWVARAYSDHLARVAYEGRLDDVLVALMPCEAGYLEIARTLRDEGSPDGPWRAWIEAYTGAEYARGVAWIEARVNAAAEVATQATIQRWRSLYTVSARYERLFFEACWRRELWPGESTT